MPDEDFGNMEFVDGVTTQVINEIDSAGNQWDDTIYQKAKDGSPKINKDGTFKKRPIRGLKIDDGATSSIEGAPSKEAVATGLVFTQAFFSTFIMIGGPAFQPIQQEFDAMNMAFVKYCEVKGVGDLPPEMMLLMVASTYAGPRLMQPEIRTKIYNVYKYYIKGERPVEPNPNAQSDSGDYNIRQNNTG